MDRPFAYKKHTILSPMPRLYPKTNPFTYCKATLAGAQKIKEANLYQLLSLESRNVGADVIKRAYRSMALRYHPDVCPPSKREESVRAFVELQRAYETLIDPIMREEYDRRLTLGSFGDGENEKRSVGFSKQVWMDQLKELEVRSAVKHTARKKQRCP